MPVPMEIEASAEGYTIECDGLVIKFLWGTARTPWGLHDVEMMAKGAQFVLTMLRLAAEDEQWDDIASRVMQVGPKEREGKLYLLNGEEE